MFSIDVFHYLFCRCFYSNQTLGKSKNQDNRVYVNVSACEYYRELKRAKSKVINRTEQDGFVLTQTNVRSFTHMDIWSTNRVRIAHAFLIYSTFWVRHIVYSCWWWLFFRQHTVYRCMCARLCLPMLMICFCPRSLSPSSFPNSMLVCVNFI